MLLAPAFEKREAPFVSLEATCSAVKTNCREVLLF